ncbi:MAG: 16S rRNA (guanine(527)-N(7))-methyltransferase RsmG [Dehalococcoidia bacterium]
MERLIAGAKRLGLSLTAQQVGKFEVYYEELIRWNKRVNLTAIVDYEEVQAKHFLDSLTIALALKDMPPSFRLLDVGSGAGVPGVPLKIIFSNISLTLLDSVRKKTDFLDHLVARLDLEGVEILTGRAEDLAREGRYREQFDLVLSRGVAPLPTLVELALPFCTLGGSFIAQKKGEIEREVEEAMGAIHILGGRLREVKRIELAPIGSGEERSLVIIDKLIATPNRYPRRAGIPQKRPLIASKQKGHRKAERPAIDRSK